MFVSYKKISNRREDCFPNGSGNMLIKSNWTRNEEAKRGKIHRCQRSLWSKKDRAYHTWTRRGRRLGIVALTHMTMYRVSRHAAFPCFAPFAPFQNDVRVSFMCHSCGATSFSNSIPRYLQSRIYIYICIPLTDVFETTRHDSPFAFSVPSDETSIRVHCLVLDLRFLCNPCCENVIWNLLSARLVGGVVGKS